MLVTTLRRTTNHISAAQIGEIISKGRQCTDNVIDICDALFPLNLFGLPNCELFEIDCGSRTNAFAHAALTPRLHTDAALRFYRGRAAEASQMSLPLTRELRPRRKRALPYSGNSFLASRYDGWVEA